MRYMGGKTRLSIRLAPVLMEHYTGGPVIEPFIGGLGMSDRLLKVGAESIVGFDASESLMAYWQAVQRGWLPPDTLTREQYYEIKADQRADLRLTAFAGYFCSFGGKLWGSYASYKNDNYAAIARRGTIKMQPTLARMALLWGDYALAESFITSDSLVYCDPPYAGVAGYGLTFDHDRFWQTMRDWSNTGATVFVSEYSAPADFKIVWEHKANVTVAHHAINKVSERLYQYAPAVETKVIRPYYIRRLTAAAPVL